MPVNLVFQGGGVRGIAYAGALEHMPPNMIIRAVAGTSAGSIVAALLAIGKSPTEIKNILKDPELTQLVHEEDARRLDRITSALSELNPVITKAIESGDISVWKLWSS